MCNGVPTILPDIIASGLQKPRSVRRPRLSASSWNSYHIDHHNASLLPVTGLKVKGCLQLLMVAHLRAAERRLPCGITQCYLPPDTVERALPNSSQRGRCSIYLPQMDGWKAQLTLLVGYIPTWFTCPQTVTHSSTNHLITIRPGVKPTTFWSRVQRPNRYATKPPNHKTNPYRSRDKPDNHNCLNANIIVVLYSQPHYITSKNMLAQCRHIVRPFAPLQRNSNHRSLSSLTQSISAINQSTELLTKCRRWEKSSSQERSWVWCLDGQDPEHVGSEQPLPRPMPPADCTQTDRDTYRQTHRQTDRQTDRDRDSDTDRESVRVLRHVGSEQPLPRPMPPADCTQTDRDTYRQTHRQTDRQTDRQGQRQWHRQRQWTSPRACR